MCVCRGEGGVGGVGGLADSIKLQSALALTVHAVVL